jgi:hypothetical protein
VTRRLAALLVSGMLLAACGTVSASSALRTWVKDSGFHSAVSTLRTDARKSAAQLRNASATANDLHTVCGVMDLEAQQANASLPTPDDQATSLLSRAYDALGAGATECYGASPSASARATAIATLERAIALLSEASARIDAATAGV